VDESYRPTFALRDVWTTGWTTSLEMTVLYWFTQKGAQRFPAVVSIVEGELRTC